MADGKKDIKITAGIEGADDVGKAADKALSPWEKKAQAVGGAIKQAFTGAFHDISRVLTVGNAISFGQAIESARRYREEVGRLSAVGGPVGQLRSQIDAIGNKHLLRASEIVDADRGLGRIVYSAKNAMSAIGGLQDEALATGETLQQKLPLGAALMNGLGVAGSDVASELGRIRDLADALGTSGGLLAAEDRLTSMSGLLTEIGAKTDSDRAKLEAMALGLGKGLGGQAGNRAAQNIMGAISGNREQFAALAGMKISSLTNEDGSLNVDAMTRAAPRVQAWVRRQSRDRGMQQMIAASLFGGDRQSGAAFLNGDFAGMAAAAAKARDTGKTAGEAASFRGSEAGQAIGRQLQMEKNARETAEGLLPVADAAQGILASHPIAGGIGMSVAGNLAGQGLGGLLGKMGQTLMGGGGAIAKGGGAAERALAAGGEKAAASLTAGGIAAKAGLAAGAAFVGYEIGSYLDKKFGISDRIAGTDAASQQGRKTADDQLLAEQQADRKKQRQTRATKIVEALARTRAIVDAGGDASDRTDITDKLAGDDAALKRLAAGGGGKVDVTGLSAEGIDIIKRAIESANLKVTIENHSESPVVANGQQNAGTLKN